MIINKNITKLDLSGKGLDKFPTEILNLKNLKKLNLSNNKIKQLPKNIDNLKRLENLDLSSNQLTAIYANVCKLNKLKVLILNNNYIKNIPVQLFELKELRKLSLSRNLLDTIPDEFRNLKKIEFLNISNNRFTEFPKIVLNINSLKTIWLSNNHFKDFPTNELLKNLFNLKSLYCFGVSSNQREEISKDYMKLSQIKGNCIRELKQLNMRIRTEQKNDRKSEASQNQRKKIFISYAKKDVKWLEKVKPFVKALNYEGNEIDIWSDQRIKAGEKWKKEIDISLENSNIAILIISSDFLVSDFIQNNELPILLKNAEEKGTKILALIVRPCRFIENKKLSQFQAVNDPKTPLSGLSDSEQEELLLKLTYDIEEYI